METANFGSVLREARERRRLSLEDVSRQTRVPHGALARIEEGHLDALPAEVFVRGFIRSYAKSVGIPDAEPIGLYEQALAARRRVEEALAATPSTPASPDVSAMGVVEEEQAPRRGIGLAVFVIIVLLIATITLSLFMRQPPQSGEGLSRADAATPTLLAARDPAPPAAG